MLFKNKNYNIHLQIYELASTVITTYTTPYYVFAFPRYNIFLKKN